MKRLLSLALCLVMVLGLFTGVVGAETIATLVIQDDFGTVIGPNSNPTLQTGLFSQFGFNAYKDSVDEANSIGNLTLVDSEGNPTDQLGVLKPGPVGTWDYLMNTDNAHPGATGYLYATEGDVTYRLPVRIGSGWTSGVYADAECKTYIPPKGRTFLLSDITANPLCYIAIVCDNSATAPQVSDNRFDLGEAIRKELDGTLYDVYGLNLKPDAEFSGTSSFQITSSLLDGDWIPTITVTDGLILTPTETDGSAMNTTDMPAWGSPGINLTYGMDYTPVPANAPVTITPDEGWAASDLGKLYYEPGSYNGQSWSWILDRGYAIPGASGTYSVTIEGKTYSFHASFATPEIVVCTLSGGNPIPLPYANIRQSFPSDDATFLVLPNTGVTITTLYSNNGFRSQVDIAEQIGGYYTISPREGIKSDISEEIIVEYTDQWNSNCSASFQIVFDYQPPVLQPEKNVTEYEPLRKNSHEFASFEHKGVTYWMLIGHGDGTEEAIDFIDSTGWTYEGEGFTNFYFDFCTYDKELNKYFRINNDDLREEILARFNGTLKFSFLPVDVDDVHKATRYPAFYEGPAGWIASCKAVYDEDSGGTFYVQVEGTLASENEGGESQYLRTYATEGAYYTVIDHQTFTSVEDLNDFLESYLDEGDSHDDTERLDVIYTGEGDLYGQIYIPDGINIKLIGGTGENRARLHGSIVSDTSFMCLINNFHFIGAGGEGADPNDIPEKWPEDDAYNAGAYNYGLGGIMNGAPENCIFEGYYHGMHIDQNSEKVHFGGFNNIYQNNHTGFYMDYSYGQGGSVDNDWCVFKNNGTAMDIQDAPNYDSLFLGRFRINNGQFINNDVDIRNESGQILWMPMNYFVHDKQFTEGNDINPAEKKRTPIIAGTITSYGKELPATIPYPMAWDDSFNDSQYYYPKSFTTENSLANRYPYVSFQQRSQELAQIMLLSDEPAEETTETVTVNSISGDKWVASMTVTEPTTANAAVYSRNMLRFRAAPQPTYTMYRIEQDGVVFVNLKSIQPEAFGEGQTWCDKSWVSVKVSLPNALEGEPNEVLASVKNGIVTFALAPGHANAEGRALYVIAPTAQATTKTADDTITVTITGEPADDSTVTVDVPEDWKGETVIVTAPDGTETEVEVAEDGTVTFDVDQEGEYTLEKKKSGLSGLIGAIVGALGGIGNDMDFTDVAKNAWYHDDVAWAYSEGLMDGTGNGKFSPDMATSRAMIVTILWRLEGSPMGVEQSDFSDVVRSSWYGYAVDWAAAFGIVEGYDGKFAPNDAITREQLAAILYRYAKYKGYDVVNTRTDLDSFTDADKVSDWALAPMQWAVGNGLINGTNDALNCGGTATRAQTAAILHRFFG